MLSALRERLEGELGYVLDIESALTEAIADQGVASSANAFLNTAVKCKLAGLEGPAMQLAKKAQDWLVHAIESDERPQRYFRYGTEAGRYYDLAMARWILNGANDWTSLDNSIELREKYLDTLMKPDRIELLLTAHEYIDAKATKKLLNRATVLWSNKKTPVEIRAAAWVDSPTGATWDGMPLFLGARIPQCYSDGSFTTMVAWLKIFYWTELRKMPVNEVINIAQNYL